MMINHYEWGDILMIYDDKSLMWWYVEYNILMMYDEKIIMNEMISWWYMMINYECDDIWW